MRFLLCLWPAPLKGGVRRHMLYTFALLRNPLKAISSETSQFGHYFGGILGERISLDPKRFARVMTLNLADPLLGFLRFPKLQELPLIMDFCSGSICYSVLEDGSVEVHDVAEEESESLVEGALPSSAFRLEPIPYSQYRAAVFARAVIDDQFLSQEDQDAIRKLGESFTQIGGNHPRAYNYQPYCSNPECEGHGTQVTQLLATVAQEPSPATSLGFLPDDPAIEFGFCMNCHCIVGSIAVD